MTVAQRGLYEILITEALATGLRALDGRLAAHTEKLRAAEAADRVALHLGRVVERALATVPDKERVAVGVVLARRLIAQVDETIAGADVLPESLAEPGTILHALRGRLPDGTPEPLPAPLIPLLDTTLLTNAPGEPRVGHQILTEIRSADRIDVVMAFVRWSGIQPLLEELRAHARAGRAVRILTTTYTGSTESRALDALCAAGAEVRVSYDTGTTRLHAKAWLFHRESGYSTAYIGSSNLTHTAQTSGLEWNVRVSSARNPDVVAKVAAVFESYWNSRDFVPYNRAEFLARREAPTDSGLSVMLSPIELRPEPFQERLLEQITLSRELGHHRNLLVSATGTGKTVMAALDYARLWEALPHARLLFVAHREEILTQSLATFRHALRDHAFGELWVGGQRPQRFEHVFASIQSLHAAGFADLDPRHFDVIIIDEFHHAAAKSYRALLDHVQPIELLGLTATPERSDGLPLLGWFDNRIAAELRLWDAIDQHRLVPFAYYGIHDGLDLRDVPWRRGRGYDADNLSRLLTANDIWAKHVIAQIVAHVDDPRTMRALGFCVSVEHARFMARVCQENGIRATAIWSDSPDEERRSALLDLAARRVNVIFSVDLFNEGIDVPTVDTLLLLRPTDSPTLFLQQLGRGLRRYRDKVACTVLDFVGHHRREFRFDRRLGALLGGSRKDILEQVESGFPFLPAGCHMELDRIAAKIVLDNIRQAVPSGWTAKVEELRRLGHRGDPSLSMFLDETGLDVNDVYTGGKSWSDLRADAGLSVHAPGPYEDTLRRASGRLLHIDDFTRIETYRRWLVANTPPDFALLGIRERRLLRMLVATVTDRAISKSTTLLEACALLWAHPQVRAELLDLLDVLAARVGHVHPSLNTHPEVPLLVHARYSRIEILAAFGIGDRAKVAPWQTGVYWAKDAGADLLAFTLDKTSGQFSPTTRYRDHAISRQLIHWESQSTTRAAGETGLRYQRHEKMGSAVMLFARLRSDERAFWFLGPASYIRHASELPMAITWRLHHALPGDLFASFAAAVA
ncbi:DNA/RNA helicase of DEAD/DEAH box family protein [Minicystis rosea]|nr:DNA/RNA helicase of DEAD/DEAH box family protein [Minicystis rosea]